MKNKIYKKIISLILVVVIILGMIAPIFATVDEKQTTSTTETLATDVYFNQDSSFTVTVPKKITMDSDKTSKYIVTLEGDISSNEVVNIIPEESFKMKDIAIIGTNKEAVEAIITQDKTQWKFDEFTTIGNGNIEAKKLSAGSWEGSFWFNIEFKTINKLSVKEDMFLVEGSNNYEIEVSNPGGGKITATSSDNSIAIPTVNENNITIEPKNEGVATITIKTEETNNYTSSEQSFKVNISHNYVGGVCQRCGEKDVFQLPAGLYDSNWKIKTSWDTLIKNKTLYLNNGILTSNVVTYTDGTAPTNNSSSALNGILIIPEEVTTLQSTFCSCDNLQGIVIPESVTAITGQPFYSKSSKLYNIMVESSNKYFKTVNGILYDINMERIIKYPANKTATSFTVPNSVKTINDSAFMSNPYIKSIVVQDGVTIIERVAFAYCTNLSSITLPNTLKEIRQWTFQGCTALKNITLPDSLQLIMQGAFQKTSLTKIYIPKSCITMSQDKIDAGYRSVFYGVPSSMKIYCGASSKPSGWSNYWNCYGVSASSPNYKLTVYWNYTREQFNALN